MSKKITDLPAQSVTTDNDLLELAVYLSPSNYVSKKITWANFIARIIGSFGNVYYGGASVVDGDFVVFDSTTGRIIKSAGFSITAPTLLNLTAGENDEGFTIPANTFVRDLYVYTDGSDTNVAVGTYVTGTDIFAQKLFKANNNNCIKINKYFKNAGQIWVHTDGGIVNLRLESQLKFYTP